MTLNTYVVVHIPYKAFLVHHLRMTYQHRQEYKFAVLNIFLYVTLGFFKKKDGEEDFCVFFDEKITNLTHVRQRS